MTTAPKTTPQSTSTSCHHRKTVLEAIARYEKFRDTLENISDEDFHEPKSWGHVRPEDERLAGLAHTLGFDNAKLFIHVEPDPSARSLTQWGVSHSTKCLALLADMLGKLSSNADTGQRSEHNPIDDLLQIQMNTEESTVETMVNGRLVKANLSGKGKLWDLFRHLRLAPNGLPRPEVERLVYAGKDKAPSALNDLKKRLNNELVPLQLFVSVENNEWSLERSV